MIKWITFALILFVSCILGVLGELLNILLTFWSGRKKSSRLFFDLFFTLYLSSPRSFGVILRRYVTHLSIVVFSWCLCCTWSSTVVRLVTSSRAVLISLSGNGDSRGLLLWGLFITSLEAVSLIFEAVSFTLEAVSWTASNSRRASSSSFLKK
jgi:hypothetical protein